MNNTKITKFNGFSILMITFVWLFEASAVSPTLGALGQDFPNVSNFKLQLVSTIPFITSVIFSLAAGVLSKYFSKKKIIIVGLLIYGVTGVIPAFATSIDQILFFRLLTGIGVGLVLPLPNVIITEHYFGEERKRMLGLGTAVSNVANVINSVLIGFLLTLGWRYCFYAFALVLVIAVINIFGLPESLPKKEVDEKEQAESKVSMRRVPKIVFVLSLFMILNWAIFQFDILNTAFFIMSEKLGEPWMIGVAIAIPGLGSIFSGTLFPELHRKFKNYIVFVGLLIFTLGFVVLYNTHSFSVLLLANILLGFGSGMLVPYILYLTSKNVTVDQRDISFGIVTSCIHLGIFASPFFQAGISMLNNNSSVRYLFMVSAIALAIATIIALIYGAKFKYEEETIDGII